MDNVLRGNEGADILTGGDGQDVLIGGAGADTLTAGDGGDVLVGGAGADNLTAGDGDDIVHGHSISQSTIDSLLAANPNIIWNEETNSFYEHVSGSSATWWGTAKSAAEAKSLNGIAGHLVVITSSAEQDFLVDQFSSGVDIWIGGSDETVDGEWLWYGGPEDGLQFWSGLSDGSVVNNFYNNWHSSEPNNTSSIEDYLRLRDVYSYQWNDAVGTTTDYIIEWDAGLMSDDNAADIVDAGEGDDIIYGYGGADDLTAGGGNDLVIAGSGNDIIVGNAGQDALYGGSGDDTIDGGGSKDSLFGGSGDDNINGGGFNDVIYGGAGHDFLYDDKVGDDIIYGEAGDDYIRGGEDSDTIDGGDGIDILSYDESAQGVFVNLSTSSVDDSSMETDSHAYGDTISNFENVVGGNSRDVITGDSNSNILTGNGEADVLKGGAGQDILLADGDLTHFSTEDFEDGLSTGWTGITADTSEGGFGGILGRIGGTSGVQAAYKTYATGTADGVVITFDLLEIDSWDGEDLDIYIDDTSIVTMNLLSNDDDEIYSGEADLGSGKTVKYYTHPTATQHIGYANVNDFFKDQIHQISLFIENPDSTVKLGFAFNTDGVVGDESLGIDNIRVYTTDETDNAFDELDYSDDTAGVTVNLMTETASGGLAEGDIINGFEFVTGGSGNDTLTGIAGRDRVNGGAGDDVLYGTGGGDRITGGDGTDRLDYSGIVHSAVITLGTTSGSAVINGSRDIFTQIEEFVLSDNGDTITGGSWDDTIIAGAGSDTIDGGAGDYDLVSFA